MKMSYHEALTRTIFAHVGRPYRWGGDDPINGFDCSGFVIECLQSVGVLPDGDWTAQGLYNRFKANPRTGNFELGDLVFFSKNVESITHVEIMLNGELAVGASGGGSATISSDVAAKQNAYIKIRPILRRKDVVAVVDTQLPWWL